MDSHWPPMPAGRQIPPPPDSQKVGHWVTMDRWRRAESAGLYVDVLDGRGQKIDRVRAYRKHPDGIEVKVLAAADDGDSTVIGGNDVVEFDGFVPGGSIRRKRP